MLFFSQLVGIKRMGVMPIQAERTFDSLFVNVAKKCTRLLSNIYFLKDRHTNIFACGFIHHTNPTYCLMIPNKNVFWNSDIFEVEIRPHSDKFKCCTLYIRVLVHMNKVWYEAHQNLK